MHLTDTCQAATLGCRPAGQRLEHCAVHSISLRGAEEAAGEKVRDDFFNVRPSAYRPGAAVMIYLPIAGLAVPLWELLAIGGGVGILSGIFGVGGGFLLTPLLIFLGIPPTVAVASGANQVLGSSVSGVLTHWRKGNVDVQMGVLLLVGGLAGSTAGVAIFAFLKRMGQIDLVIALSYVAFLVVVGGIMFIESMRAMSAAGKAAPRRKRHNRFQGWPWRRRFPKSRLYISALLPLAVGAVGGILSAIMGVGGGFVLVPMMIYILGMPTAVVVGTSLFQVIFVTANVTFLQAVTTHTVDVVLALMLLVGGAVGAQLGAKVGVRLRAEQLRLLLALIVLGVGGRMAYDLIEPPDDVYALEVRVD